MLMCVVTLFANRYYSYSFSPILTKLGAYTIYMCKHAKNVEQVFKILILKFLAIFLNFTFGLNSSGAI